jgi:hypothetical protein
MFSDEIFGGSGLEPRIFGVSGLHLAITLLLRRLQPSQPTMLQLYAACYRVYRAVFEPQSKIAALRRSKNHTPVSLDNDATLLGDAYRGSGVLVGILGALIIFCAIAPFGLGVGGMPVAQIFGVAEVVLMVLVILTIVSVRKGSKNKSDLKARWFEARSAAEQVRYKPLQDISSSSLSEICHVVEPLLGLQAGSNDDQITYNERSAERYHAIELAAERATLFGFTVSLAAAATHLLFHLDALIFLTGFLPAAVGALHGINAFLKLEPLSEDHHRMAEELKSLRNEFLIAVASKELNRVCELTQRIHDLLSTGHLGWRNIAKKVKVNAP